MREVDGLSRVFVESHVAEAARVLEGLAPADTAQFIAALAPSLAASALRHMNPAYCAKLFEQFEDGPATELIRIIGSQAAARILEQLPGERHGQLLALLPVATAVAIRVLIGYPAGTCGASMSPWSLVLTPEMPVARALEEIRRFDGEIGDCVFVTDEPGRLLGIASLPALVRAEPDAELSAVMIAPEHALSALTNVSAVANHPGWNDFHVLPVVERENRLVGALYRHALDGRPAGREPDLAGGVAGAYWKTVSVLTQVVVGALPPVTPVARARRNDER
jgi:magnesium transporter